MRFKKGKTYKIWWMDVHHDSKWNTIDEALIWAESIKPIVLNGQEFLGMTEHFHIFTSGKAGDGDRYDITLIPRKMILKAKELH